MLEGRHGGLVDTKALGEDNGPCLLYGYDCEFLFGFLCLLLQASVVLRRSGVSMPCHALTQCYSFALLFSQRITSHHFYLLHSSSTHFSFCLLLC